MVIAPHSSFFNSVSVAGMFVCVCVLQYFYEKCKYFTSSSLSCHKLISCTSLKIYKQTFKQKVLKNNNNKPNNISLVKGFSLFGTVVTALSCRKLMSDSVASSGGNTAPVVLIPSGTSRDTVSPSK